MSDLVKRLRGETDLGECGRLCDEAATAVERLERTVERVKRKCEEIQDNQFQPLGMKTLAQEIRRELERGEERCPIHDDVDWAKNLCCPHCGKSRVVRFHADEP